MNSFSPDELDALNKIWAEEHNGEKLNDADLLELANRLMTAVSFGEK